MEKGIMDNAQSSIEGDVIALQVSKEITSLFKFYLELVEQLKLTEEQHSLLRKQILNHGNDSIRNILQFLALFDFTINPKKVKEESQKRILFKKSIICAPVKIE